MYGGHDFTAAPQHGSGAVVSAALSSGPAVGQDRHEQDRTIRHSLDIRPALTCAFWTYPHSGAHT